MVPLLRELIVAAALMATAGPVVAARLVPMRLRWICGWSTSFWHHWPPDASRPTDEAATLFSLQRAATYCERRISVDSSQFQCWLMRDQREAIITKFPDRWLRDLRFLAMLPAKDSS